MKQPARLWCLLLALLLFVCAFPLSAHAAPKVTDKDIADFVKYALKQENKTNSDLKLPHDDWCSYFVGHCINNSKVGKALGSVTIENYPCAPDLADWICNVKKAGKIYMLDSYFFNRMRSLYSSDPYKAGRMELADQSKFKPKAGDLVLFNNSGRKTKYFDHVAIVTKVTGSRIEHIDGNSGGGGWANSKVVLHNGSAGTAKNSKRIIGYVRIETNGSSGSSTSSTSPTTNTKISFSGIKPPNGGTLQYGKGYHISGKITATGGKIAKIEAKVIDRDGKAVMTKSKKTDAANYTLNNSDLDWALAFGELPAGHYTLKYTVTPNKGNAATKSTQFTVVLPSKYYTLSPRNASGTCLDVKGGGKTDGTNVQIYAANKTGSQQWKLQHVGKGWYTLSARNSGKALDVQNANTVSGTNVQQYTANGTGAQKWYLQSAGDGYFLLLPEINPKLALDVYNANRQNGTNVWVYTRNNTDAQKWKIEAV